tara:strand:+ start:56 stop:604 length:549 start_codon:yes stop_codon:yes gene_type:complete
MSPYYDEHSLNRLKMTKMKSGFRLNEMNFSLDNFSQNSKKIFEKKRVTLFSISQNLISEKTDYLIKNFENNYDSIKKLGIHEIYYCGLENFINLKKRFNKIKINKIKILPDEKGVFAEHLGMLTFQSKENKKYQDKNYMAIITDGIIEKWWEDIYNLKNTDKDSHINVIKAENCLEYLHGAE